MLRSEFLESLSDANMHGADTSMSMILSKEDEERRWKANHLLFFTTSSTTLQPLTC